jgi:putative membrane protein
MIPRLVILAALVAAPPAAVAQTAPAPNDAQIAHIANTAGELDIAAAKQALAKSKDKAVREFANEMVRDHTAVNEKASALVRRLHVTPQPNPTSASLTKAADAKRKELAGLSGRAFDRGYADNEVKYHKTVNAALKDTLIPDAHNAELKSLLQTGLKLFQQHQMHAEQLAAGLK